MGGGVADTITGDQDITPQPTFPKEVAPSPLSQKRKINLKGLNFELMNIFSSHMRIED